MEDVHKIQRVFSNYFLFENLSNRKYINFLFKS